MLYELRLTKINPNMTAAVVECLYANAGSALKVGDKLCDLSVDLSSGFSQYCPPISYFRVVVREKVWLRKLLVVPGDSCEVGQLLALFSAEQDSPEDAVPSRPVRITTAGIAYHPGMWSASER
jgi:hypothetical protein